MGAHDRARGMLSAFDSVGFGAALVDHQGIVVDKNAQFEQHLEDGIQIIDGRLCGGDRRKSLELDRLARCRIQPGARLIRDAVVLPVNGRPPLIVYKVALPTGPGDRVCGLSGLVLLVNAGRSAKPSADMLRHLFCLTPSEVDVAQQFADGRDVAEIAKSRGVTVGTLRIQLKSIFAKTGATRQVELAILLTKLAAGLELRPTEH